MARPKGLKDGECSVCQDAKAEYYRRTFISGGFAQLKAEGCTFSRNTLVKCTKEHRPEELRQSVGLTVADKIEHKAINAEKEKAQNYIVNLVTREGWTEEVDRYSQEIDETMQKMRSSGQINHYTNLGHVKVKLLELSAKVQGFSGPDTAIQINNFLNSEDYKKLKQVVIQALLPYPEAAFAVAEAMEREGL